MNVSYVSKESGVTLALNVDNHVYYSKGVSCRFPLFRSVDVSTRTCRVIPQDGFRRIFPFYRRLRRPGTPPGY